MKNNIRVCAWVHEMAEWMYSNKKKLFDMDDDRYLLSEILEENNIYVPDNTCRNLGENGLITSISKSKWRVPTIMRHILDCSYGSDVVEFY